MQTNQKLTKSEESRAKFTNIRKFLKRHKILLYLAVSFLSLLFFSLLIFYKPADFEQPKPTESKEVSKYLTHVITPELYNGAQRGEPFDLVITEEGINDVIAGLKWPQYAGWASFSVPQVLFKPGKIVLRGTAGIDNMDIFVAIEGKPYIDPEGLLNLDVTKIKVGAMNLTIIAKIIAASMFKKELAENDVDPRDWGYKIAAALFQSQPFEPILDVEKSKVRIKAVNLKQKILTIHFIPVEQEKN